MAGFKNIEASIIIKAVDGTGRTFAQIADKIAQVTRAANRFKGTNFAGMTSPQMVANLKHIDRVMGEVRRAETVASRLPMMPRGPGVTSDAPAGAPHGNLGMEASLAAGGAGAVAKKLAHQAATVEHERVRMAAAGMQSTEIDDAVAQSVQLGQKFKTTSQADILHMLRNARSIVGTFEEAAQLADPLLRLRTIAQGAHPEKAEGLAEEFDKLIKGLEIKGVTQNMPAFKSYMEGMAKAVNVFGDTLRPTDFYEMFKYGRQSTTGLSQKYMLETAPTLAQELGGSSAGKAQQAFFQAIVGGKMKDAAAKALNDIGLVDPSKIYRTKTGSIKGIMPGGVVGADLAASNPYDWVNKILIPALAKNNITSKEDINKYIAGIFSNATAAQLASIFATQQSRIEKDHKLVKGAEGLSAADRFMQSDPAMALAGVTTSLNNLAASAGQPFLDPAIAGLNKLSDALGSLNQRLAVSKVDAAAAGVGAVAAGGAATAVGGAGALGLAGIGPGAGAVAAGIGSSVLPIAVIAGAVYVGAKIRESHQTPEYIKSEIARINANAAAHQGHYVVPSGMGFVWSPAELKAHLDGLQKQLDAMSPKGAANAPATLAPAKPAEVKLDPASKADVNIKVTVDVKPSGDLIKAVESARAATTSAAGSVRANLTGAGSVGRSGAETGPQ